MIVYIAHPISGHIEDNLADLRRIIRWVNNNTTHTPFVPYYADVVSLDDNIPAQRARGIVNNRQHFERRAFEQLWLTGPHISVGMLEEMEWAKQYDIRVVDKIGLI